MLSFFRSELATLDPAVADLIRYEAERQGRGGEPIRNVAREMIRVSEKLPGQKLLEEHLPLFPVDAAVGVHVHDRSGELRIQFQQIFIPVLGCIGCMLFNDDFRFFLWIFREPDPVILHHIAILTPFLLPPTGNMFL